MKLKAFILILLSIPLLSFLVVWDGRYHPNGVINCLFVKFLNQKSKSIYKDALPLVIPRIEAFDIDTEEDLKIIKKIY